MTTLQAPIDSPFRASSSVDDVIQGIDLRGKTLIVTGGYSGLGLEAVRVLAGAGARVVVPARNLEKAAASLSGIADVGIAKLDLLDPASIDAFVGGFLNQHDRLDVLINCAGVMAAPLTRDGRGYESQFSTNVLGHFQLICGLKPALLAAGGARVISLSSSNHRVKIPNLLHDPNFEHTDYQPWVAYANSKAANILLTVALDSILKGQGVRAFAVHPGGIFQTGLLRHVEDLSIAKAAGMIDENGEPIIDPDKGWKTPAQGASTIVWAATSPLLAGRGGVYCSNNNIGPLLETDEGPLDQTAVIPGAKDPVNAGRLWRLCEELTGARLD